MIAPLRRGPPVFYGDRPPARSHRPGRRRRRRRARRLARARDRAASSPSAAAATAGRSQRHRGGIVLDLAGHGRSTSTWRGAPRGPRPGLTAGEYTTAAGAHGLATGFGDTGSVGIGGITLGGGVGYLVRKHGLTIDDLLAAELVTADGELLRVDAETPSGPVLGDPRRRRQLRRRHPVPVPAAPGRPDRRRDADAAGHGGGRRRLHRRGRGRAGGAVDHRQRHAGAADAVRARGAHGKLVIMAHVVYAGEIEAGERAVAPFRALAAPDRRHGPADAVPGDLPARGRGLPPVAVARTLFMDTVDPRRPDDRRPARGLEGAMRGRPAAGAGRRDGARAGRGDRVRPPPSAGSWSTSPRSTRDPMRRAVRQAWVDDFAARAAARATRRVRQLPGRRGRGPGPRGLPRATWDRLAAIKAPSRRSARATWSVARGERGCRP